MALELDRAAFKRLVWLYIASGIVSLMIVGAEYVVPAWVEFAVRFDGMVIEVFGEENVSTPLAVALGMVMLIGAAWMIASTIGLLWFRRWARWGLWASTLLLLSLFLLMFHPRPSFSTPIADVASFIDSALFGAIMLIAYAKDHGDVWFTGSSAIKD